jgi:CheY-like chemotaxis protein
MPDEPLRILIVEDDPPVAAVMKETIEAKVASNCTIETSFDNALRIAGPPFDVVILDQMRGAPPQNDVAGRPIWQRLHEDSFVPVVVYSAVDVELGDFPENNPVLAYIQKTADSLAALANHLAERQTLYLGLRHLKAELSLVMRGVFLEVAPILIPDKGSAEDNAKHLARAARRRIAAMMDLSTLHSNENLLAWEQYVCPPLGAQWLTGDILHLNGTPDNDPSSYRLMLTPSCDLPRGDGTCKVESVLVCHCVPIGDFFVMAKAGQKSEKKFEESIRPSLTRAHVDGLIPLPSYHDKLPSMAAELKHLELIPIGEIGGEHKYKIVASIDSPFREQISWAFIEVQGRPGVPDRNLGAWIKELWEEVGKNEKENDDKKTTSGD